MTSSASSRPRAAVILAAGQGTRMKSPTPKVLHRIAGRALLDHAIDAAEALGCERIIVVVGTHSPAVGVHARKRLGETAVVIQDPPMGTGHAVLAAKEALADFDGDVVVTFADCPLLTAPVIAPLFDLRASGADVAVLGFEAHDPGAYGRLILAPGHVLLRIVEAKDATERERAIGLCNSGVMAVDGGRLFGWLDRVGNANAKGEYYLTDIVEIANARGLRVGATEADYENVLGINNRAELAEAEAIWQHFEHAVGDDGFTRFGALLDDREHQLLLAHAAGVFDLKLFGLLEDFRHVQCLEFV